MTDPDNFSDDPIYVADPIKEKQAKTLHYTVSIIRLLGIAILLVGIAISVGRIAAIPIWAGYVLIFVGLAQAWVVPFVMVRSFVKRQVAEQQAKDAGDDV